MNKTLSRVGVGLGVVGLLALGTISAGVASWATTVDDAPVVTPRPPSITWKEDPAVFAAETKKFTQPLPEGIAWPAALPSNLLEENVEMEVGIPEAIASFYWLCAWEDKFVSATDRGATEDASAALAMVEKFVELPFYKEHFEDPNRVWYQTVVEATKAGDLTGLKVDLNGCAYYFANQK